ncbi:hypothetical protein ABE522_05030 [Stenotrophomonas pennii]|uniref:hypothetical protein n=1 Tax=Stenotrophomonas lacuserhaii TaxID=2760084 RepID=UPI00320A3433
MFDLAGIAKVVAGVCLAALWVVVLLTHRYLRKLQRERPELIAQVGMVSVDWWIGCLRGMFLLGFTDTGEDLPTSKRWLVRTASVGYPLFVIAGGAYMLLASNGHGP